MRKSRDSGLRVRFGNVLRERRRERGLTQEELAHQTGLDVSFISRVERGLQAPSIEVVFVLASALGEAPHDLVRRAEA